MTCLKTLTYNWFPYEAVFLKLNYVNSISPPKLHYKRQKNRFYTNNKREYQSYMLEFIGKTKNHSIASGEAGSKEMQFPLTKREVKEKQRH